ncbi:PHD finger protein 19 [Festucalex cinctus]
MSNRRREDATKAAASNTVVMFEDLLEGLCVEAPSCAPARWEGSEDDVRPEDDDDDVRLQSGLSVGQFVLCHWSDGLYYVGKILRVSPPRRSCFVTFEDNSKFWVLWKDIQHAGVPGEEPRCSVCLEAGPSTAAQLNQILICGKCGIGFHQQCHIPPVEGSADTSPWFCRRCVFALAVRKGGALKKGPLAKSLLSMKQVLSYDLDALQWDAQHRTNQQQSYCYCGGPGEWYLKMLQCLGCQQWFHEACTQCLHESMMFGDRFYAFTCCVCNKGCEQVRRLPLRWVDVVHLVLYNLSLSNKKKYFELDQILAFVNAHWEALQLAKLADTPPADRGQHLLDALNKYKSKFLCGKEMKKRKCIFRLRTRVPPTPPSKLFPGERGRDCKKAIGAVSASSERKKRKSKWLFDDAIPDNRHQHMAAIFDFTLDQLHKIRSRTSGVEQDSRDASATTPANDSLQTDRQKVGSRKRKLASSAYKHTANGSEAVAEEEEPSARGEEEGPRAVPSSRIPSVRPRDASRLRVAISALLGAAGRATGGERCHVLARRLTADGHLQYLLQWEGCARY